MVHNNFHANEKERYKVTCLIDDVGGLMTEKNMYRYNFEKFLITEFTIVRKFNRSIAMRDRVVKNMRVVRCFGEHPGMDVTGIMGISNGKWTQ